MARSRPSGGGVKVSGIEKVDLSEFNKKAATDIRKSIRRGLNNKRAVSGQRVPKNAKSTIKRKGKDHRNIDTRALYNGIEINHGQWFFEVTVSDDAHPNSKKGASIHQVGQWNQASNPNANKHHKAAKVLVDWFGITESMATDIVQKFEVEMFNQLDAYITIEGTIEGTIG